MNKIDIATIGLRLLACKKLRKSEARILSRACKKRNFDTPQFIKTIARS
jgi:hypothetical protein